MTVLLACAACSEPGAQRERPVPVVVAQVELADVPRELAAVGLVEPERSVAVRAQVSGLVTEIAIAEGQDVAAGQLVARIDSRPYAVALKQAEAALARERVQAAHAAEQAQRYRALAQKAYATQEQQQTTAAAAASSAAAVLAAEAAVERARLELAYCTISAPLAGRAGAIAVKAGNLVRAGDPQPLVTINQLDPILVRFTVPERSLAALLAAVHDAGARQTDAGNQRSAGQARADAGGEHGLLVLVTPSGADAIVAGQLSFIDNAVDQASGAIALKARFDNRERALWPGQFAAVRLQLGLRRAAPVVPDRAVVSGQRGEYVFVVGPEQRVAVRPVRSGGTHAGRTLIEDGLAAGERVVVDGQVRLTEGALVSSKGEPRPDRVAPSGAASPSPAGNPARAGGPQPHAVDPTQRQP